MRREAGAVYGVPTLPSEVVTGGQALLASEAWEGCLMPLYGEPVRDPIWKPKRGSGVLEREKREAEDTALEIAAKKAAKERAGWKCRWPERHKCRGGLEAAHIRDASLGGEMHPRNLFVCCAWIHRRGPDSIHSKDLRVLPVSKTAGANGPVRCYRKVFSETRRGEFTWKLVGEV